MERAPPSPFIKNATLERSIFYVTINWNQFKYAFTECTLLNHRMPKCNTVLQSKNDLFEPEIHTNFSENGQLKVKQKRSLCFTLVFNSNKNTAFC